MKNLTSLPPAACLIVVRDVIVRLDLAHIIAGDQPQARVIAVTTFDAAVLALADISAIDIAFVAAEPEDFENSPLARCLAERGGQVVLMGAMASQSAPLARWRLLPFPFTTDDVRRLIATPEGTRCVANR